MPQLPCPLVHPLATFVPTPTSSPPAIINGSEFVIRNGISFVVENENIIGPTIRPTRNKKLSPLPSFEVRKLSVILLMPASRPLPINNTTTAKPIVIPPTKADKGVKFIIFILIFLYLFIILYAKKLLSASLFKHDFIYVNLNFFLNFLQPKPYFEVH